MNYTTSNFRAKWLVPIAFILFIATSTACSQTREKGPSFSQIESGFKSIPDSVQLAVYWYWMSDNISVEGVQRDLESMKKVGINRAFIGNIGGQNVPYGDVKILTPEWWKVTHAALKKATELNIEIGMFNSPGWSQSGGPWVKPEQSMRYLGSADTTIVGGQKIQIKLPSVTPFKISGEPRKGAQSNLAQRNHTEDVRIIAYPASDNKDSGIKTWKFQKKQAEPLTLEMTMEKHETVRTLLFTTEKTIKTEAELFVKEGDTYRMLKKITLDRSNASLNVGFYPWAPIVISIPETKSNAFRLVFATDGAGEMNVTLSSQPQIERYPEKSLAKMFQRPLPMFKDYLWDRQADVPEALCVAPQKVIDVTGFVKNGVLNWNAPTGKWIITRMAMLTTGVTNGPASPEGTGLEIDKMSKKHVAAHFEAFIGEILRRIPEADRKTFRVVVEDSYETGGQNWTDDMIDYFKTANGYDPVPYLPVLKGVVVGSPDLSDRFLWDLRRLIADKVAYDYVAGLREISNKHGLTTWLENYGHWGFPGEFLQYGGQSDEIGGEFWSEGSLGDIENRAASSCAHTYGKRKVWAESCTAGGKAFQRYPYLMKQRVDRFFTEGINATLLHLYIQQPEETKLPGINAPFGNEFNRKNTWFSHMDVFGSYLKRCNFMLQQGLYVADVAYFIGEDAPKMTGETNPSLPQGYSFDYINAEVLLNRATVKDGKLMLPDGMNYRLLVLPPLETMRPQLLRKIKEMVMAGLVIMGPAPQRSPSLVNYPKADQEVKALAAGLWENGSQSFKKVGKGKVYAAGYNIQKVLSELGVVPDFSAANDPNANVLFIHRTLSKGEVYFVSNQSEEVLKFSPSFRISGLIPEYWSPVTGETRQLTEFTLGKSTTTVPITLQPLESVFIVFRNPGNAVKDAVANFPEMKSLLVVNSPWQVTFTGLNAPQPLQMKSLQDWTTSQDKKLCYFSGTANYKTTFTLTQKPSQPISIDLGKVMVMAKVKVNGQYVGGVWTPPYRLDITSAVKSGVNNLEVEVVNNWINRLIGDLNLPENERTTWTIVNPWKKDTPLQSSGLIGPVTIQ